jgi:hypothetical protein
VTVSELQLVEPFDIDNGELDGHSTAGAFALGVEWQQFRSELQSVLGFEKTVNRANVERLIRMCVRRGRRYRIRHLDDHWTEITVHDTLDTEAVS